MYRLAEKMQNLARASVLGGQDRHNEKLSWMENLVQTAPQAACAVNEENDVMFENAAALPLTQCLAFPDPGTPGGAFSEMLTTCREENRPVCERLPISTEDIPLVFDVWCLPVNGGKEKYVLVFARDISPEMKLTDALMRSRHLFKDLVECSADFAWETRSDGSFSFVSSRGALGYDAAELDGSPARVLLVRNAKQALFNPFESKTESRDREIRLRRRDGSAMAVEVSAMPIFADNGDWVGARGICRDISEIKARSEALARAQQQEQLVQNIVATIHSELQPVDMLAQAVQSVANALEVSNCWILKAAGDGKLVICASHGDQPDLDAALPAAIEAVRDLVPSDNLLETIMNDQNLAIAGCDHLSNHKGYLVAALGKSERHWTADQTGFLRGVAVHIGVVIAQAETQVNLERLSRTDELTGLFNRRAFYEEVDRRINHMARTGRSGALLYLDLDNFKTVNDARGHADGDALLTEFSDLLRAQSRVSDVPGRLGGDEFVLWLDETDEMGARTKAKAILRAFEPLQRYSGPEGEPLNVSIGIAVTAANDHVPLDDLLALADNALYEVKRAGKGNLAVRTATPKPRG